MLFDILYTSHSISNGPVHHSQVSAENRDAAVSAAKEAADPDDFIISIHVHNADLL